MFILIKYLCMSCGFELLVTYMPSQVACKSMFQGVCVSSHLRIHGLRMSKMPNSLTDGHKDKNSEELYCVTSFG